jgi:hypothetical protein
LCGRFTEGTAIGLETADFSLASRVLELGFLKPAASIDFAADFATIDE